MIDFNFKGVYFKKNLIKKMVTTTAQKVFCDADINNYSISFLITKNKSIKMINKQFRNLDNPTDVLSFPSNKDFKGDTDGFFGDIIISIQRTKKQAKSFNQSFSRELCFLTVHGCLHLLGYDHIQPDCEKEMILKQKEIMQQLSKEIGAGF